MAKFAYVVKDRLGKTKTDTVEAPDRDALITKLQTEGYYIISIQELSIQSLSKPKIKSRAQQKTFTHKGIKLDDLLVFSKQLATMLDSGVTLLRSLDVIVSQVESEQLYAVTIKVKGDIEQGSSLSSSLAKHPKVFNQFWVSLIEVGEASGTMPVVLEKLCFYLEQQAAFRSTIVSAVLYPAILFVVAMGAICFFAFFVGPKFEAIFKSFNVPLPIITKVLLSSFNFLQKKIFLILGMFAVFIFLLKRYTKTYYGQLQKEKFLFSLPVIGQVYRLIIVERFTSQMAILIDSGVPILYALEITQKLVSNKTCEFIVSDIKEAVKEGKLLVEPMKKSGFFPQMAIQMIMVGEETGELSQMLKHVANFHQKSVETFMKRFATMIEPVMLVFMGAVIGLIVVAMFLPMFNITQLG